MITGMTDTLIPMFITAESLEAFRSLMNEVNTFYGKSFKYDWKFANGEYVALYYLDINDLNKLALEKGKEVK